MNGRHWGMVGVLSLGLLSSAAAADWPNWRGPAFNGSSPETGLPVKFSMTENVAWSTPLPGPSAGTPIVVRDRIFLSSTDPANEGLLAMCLDRKTGKLLWKDRAGSGYRPAGKGTALSLDYRSNYASPSPTSDGKHVVFFYGNGDLVSYTLDGNREWSRNLQKEDGDFCFGWTFSSSPLLWKNRLYLQILQRNFAVSGRGKDGAQSYLLALDPATGKELWRSIRECPAKMESREAFTTPIPYTHQGREEILIAGGDILSGHDPKTGREFWRWGTWNTNHLRPDYRLVPSPVAGAGMVLGCGPKREPVFAIKLGQNGDLTQAGPAWQSEARNQVTTDVPTPLFYQDRFYVLSDLRKAITCVNPADGKIVWTTSLEGPSMCWASPTGADGKLYLLKLNGEALVLDAATGSILHSTPMAVEEDEIRSSIVAAGGSLYIRTNSRLYCLSTKKLAARPTALRARPAS